MFQDTNANAENFLIDIVWQPDIQWINFEHTTVINPAFSTNCPEKSNVCKFETLTKEIGPIKLEYSIQIDWKKYQEIKNQNPQILFNYNYDGMPEGSKLIAVNVNVPPS